MRPTGPTPKILTPQQLLTSLRSREDLRDRIRHVEIQASCPPRYQSLPPELDPRLREVLEKAGYDGLWTHQAQTWEVLRKREHAAVTTPTASGKTLCFNLPVLDSILRRPNTKALYLYPMKALAQDQLKTLQEWMGRFRSAKRPGFSAEIYDGDTPTGVRAKIKKNPPNILLTNPDMLHLGFLAFHEGWAGFFKDLEYVVVDEAHSYRGIFGAHVAHVLRRLRRVCRLHGSDPRFVACSATLGNPGEFLRELTGLDFKVISESGAPVNGKTFVLWNPETTSPYSDAVTLLLECLQAGLKTIVFTKARKITELISLWVTQARPEWASRIRSYRAGYLPEERREIEALLFKDELQAVISTSALEVGIDVGGLDACILVGYPGTMISTTQRAGRVGRGQGPSMVFLIGMADALDQFWMKHPQRFFHQGPESLRVGFDNPIIARAHLRCAASEVPLTREDAPFYGKLLDELVPAMTAEGELLESASGGRWLVTDRNPQRALSIRDMGEGFQIVTQDEGELIGTIDGMRAFRDCHPGAVYLHQGVQYVVKDLQWEQRKILVSDEPVDYYTQVNYEEETEILEERRSRPLGPGSAQCRVKWGRVRITQRFINYEVHRILDQSLVSTYPLTLPPQTFETQALWMALPEGLQRKAAERGIHFMGGLHAAEHGTIAMMPLKVVCDRWDLGGISTPAHPQVPQPVIFVYDGYPGGVGLTDKAYEDLEDLLTMTYEMVRDCSCEEGCPSCIQSPKCGSGNHPLDKKGARMILGHILGRDDLGPSGAPPLSGKSSNPADPEVREEALGKEAPAVIQSSHKPLPSPDQAPPPVRTGPVVFDIETQFLSNEIPGGWNNLPGMRLSCAVVYDVEQARYFTYLEPGVQDLLAHLKAASKVVGFNSLRFDYGVLQGYTREDLSKLPTLDLMADLQKKLKHRLSLAHLAQHTLGGAEKSADGLLAVKWWREGKYEQVIDYCRMDVKLTLDLWNFGKEKGHVLFQHKATGEILRCPVSWG